MLDHIAFGRFHARGLANRFDANNRRVGNLQNLVKDNIGLDQPRARVFLRKVGMLVQPLINRA